MHLGKKKTKHVFVLERGENLRFIGVLQPKMDGLGTISASSDPRCSFMHASFFQGWWFGFFVCFGVGGFGFFLQRWGGSPLSLL